MAAEAAVPSAEAAADPLAVHTAAEAVPSVDSGPAAVPHDVSAPEAVIIVHPDSVEVYRPDRRATTDVPISDAVIAGRTWARPSS